MPPQGWQSTQVNPAALNWVWLAGAVAAPRAGLAALRLAAGAALDAVAEGLEAAGLALRAAAGSRS